LNLLFIAAAALAAAIQTSHLTQARPRSGRQQFIALLQPTKHTPDE